MPVSGSSARLCVDYIPATMGSRRVSILPRGTRPAYARQCRRSVQRSYASVSRSQTPSPAIIHITKGLNTRGPRLGHEYMRQYATAAANEARSDVAAELQGGPLKEYDARVQQGRLRDDPYQRRTSYPLLRYLRSTPRGMVNADDWIHAQR